MNRFMQKKQVALSGKMNASMVIHGDNDRESRVSVELTDERDCVLSTLESKHEESY